MQKIKDEALDWGATALTVGGVFTALGLYDVVQRVAIRFGPVAHQRAVSGMARAIMGAARLSGTRFRMEGRSNVVPGRPYIIVSNHQSLMDISMTSAFLAELQPRYVSKLELAKGVPGVSFNLRRGGSACINRKDPIQARKEISELGRRVKDDGWSVLIFPEGTRSTTGRMRAFREIGLKTLVKEAPGVEILPVTTSGGSRLFRHRLRPIVRNVELVYRIHPPVMPPDPSDNKAFSAFVARLHESIRSALPPEDLLTPDSASS